MDTFWDKVDRSGGPDGCWPWLGTVRKRDGYGTFGSKMAHRVAWERLVGPLPPRKRGESGMELDHRWCQTRLCVNPAHMELVTHAVNVSRSGVGALQRAKTHCPAGHAYDEANTYLRGGRRACRECQRDASQRYYDTNRRRPRPESLRTHCPAGHAYDEANTLVSGGKRYCRACARERSNRWYAEHKKEGHHGMA